MAQQGVNGDQKTDRDQQSAQRPRDIPSPLDSGLRRKFLQYCEENPWADECRVYEV
jgi:hypothetical protein